MPVVTAPASSNWFTSAVTRRAGKPVSSTKAVFGTGAPAFLMTFSTAVSASASGEWVAKNLRNPRSSAR
ncbi:hypothetical protein D3C73_1385620 [compost metagenome]